MLFTKNILKRKYTWWDVSTGQYQIHLFTDLLWSYVKYKWGEEWCKHLGKQHTQILLKWIQHNSQKNTPSQWSHYYNSPLKPPLRVNRCLGISLDTFDNYLCLMEVFFYSKFSKTSVFCICVSVCGTAWQEAGIMLLLSKEHSPQVKRIFKGLLLESHLSAVMGIAMSCYF